MNWRQDRFVVLAIVAAALIAYVPTAQPDISATNNPYFADVGSIQDALSLSGTLHGSGYPLYAFTGSVFVAVLRAVGIAPALAASLYSTLWGVASLIALYALIVTWLNDRAAALVGTGVLGASNMFWLFSSYAEVYTLATFVIILALWVAIKADRTRQARYVYALAICCGMAVAHHRAIALALPAPVLIALPALWAEFRRRWTFAIKWIGLAVLTGVVPYAYIVIRLAQGSNWIWGDPSTLDGLWRLIFGSAYTSIISWPTTTPGWLNMIGRVIGSGLEIMPWWLAILGLAGVAWLLVRKHHRYGLALILGALPSFAFAVSVQTTFVDFVIEDVPALLYTSMICLLCGFAFLMNDLRSRASIARPVILAIGAVTCVVMAVQSQPVVYAMTHDTTGRHYIDAARQFLDDMPGPEPPAFFSIWGGEYWALAYGRYETGELAKLNLLPNRANLSQAADQYGRLYTFEWTFYNRDLDWWRKKLGKKVFLSSAGVDTVAIATAPPLTENDLPRNTPVPVAMGAAIVLRDWQVKPLGNGTWQITLYWQANHKPDRDYSVFVQASDRASIDGPDAIVAQADTRAPVHGWYPTSLWSPGEIVRDDHLVVAPPDRPATIVAVGLYTQDAAGNFQNFGRQIIPLR